MEDATKDRSSGAHDQGQERRQRSQASSGRGKKKGWAHGYGRQSASEPRVHMPVESENRSAGVPLLLLVVLGVLTSVGLAKVHHRTRVLELGEDISMLTQQNSELLDRKRRLETERAFLRHPDRIRAQASERFDMVPASPERIQSIQLKGPSK